MLPFGAVLFVVVAIMIAWCLHIHTHTRSHTKHIRQRFLISLNSIDCINFDAKTIIYWIKINCSICILRFVPSRHYHRHYHQRRSRTAIGAQYNFYSWFRIFFLFQLPCPPSPLCISACVCVLFLRSLFIHLHNFIAHIIPAISHSVLHAARLVPLFFVFGGLFSRFPNTLLVNFYWAQSIL